MGQDGDLRRLYLCPNSNSSDAFPNGFQTIATGIFVPPGEVTATFYDINQVMHTIWVGAKYDVRSDLSIAASFTYQRQNDFLPASAICTGSGVNTSSPRCAGSQSAISFLIDYQLIPRADLYVRDGLECLRRPRKRRLQAAEHRPDHRPPHPVLTG
jgi:hypothetical protein